MPELRDDPWLGRALGFAGLFDGGLAALDERELPEDERARDAGGLLRELDSDGEGRRAEEPDEREGGRSTRDG